MSSPEQRLVEAGWELPELRPPAGDYTGATPVGDLLFLSGQGSEGHSGRVGDDMTLEAGRLAARACMLNLLAQTRAALGSLDAVRYPVKVLGFISCTEGFAELPKVLDAASEVLHVAFGDDGRHSRSAVGVQALPLGFAVEVEMVVRTRGEA